jgi:hypothetical protein
MTKRRRSEPDRERFAQCRLADRRAHRHRVPDGVVGEGVEQLVDTRFSPCRDEATDDLFGFGCHDTAPHR